MATGRRRGIHRRPILGPYHFLLPRKRTTHTHTHTHPQLTPTHLQPPTATLPGKSGSPGKRDPQSTQSTDSYVHYIPSPPDGGWGWVVVLASLFCNMIVDGIGYSFGVFLLEFADYFQESKSKVSLVGSLLCGVYNIAGPVVSALTNKFGCRLVVMVGSVVAGVAFLASSQAPSVDFLIVSYGVVGGESPVTSADVMCP
ncbi:hypothetical protein ACOMHN_066610 [Nucella lapillus]